MTNYFPILRPEPAIYLLAALLGAIIFLILAQPAWGADFRAYHWKHRLLLVFAPNDADPRLMAFEKRVATRDEDMQDRDLLVFRLLEAGPSGRPAAPMKAADVETLRRRYKAPGGFVVILIGKDGGVKQVQEERVSLQAIFDLIDTMPMRRREMRQKDAARNTINGQ